MRLVFLLFEFELDLRLFVFELLLKLCEPLDDVISAIKYNIFHNLHRLIRNT